MLQIIKIKKYENKQKVLNKKLQYKTLVKKILA